MEIKIETGISIPEKYPNRNRYPFAQMEVGQSFSVPWGQSVADRIRASVNNFQIRNRGKKFSTRHIHDENVVRVWRIA